MNKIAILLFVIISFISFEVKSEVINVCGSDTVVLSVDNYVNGIIEWEESSDTTLWSPISNQNAITFKFHPTESKYYRAVVKTSSCSPLYSEISYVQVIPTANAGTDRSIGTKSTVLLGNMVAGATGMWTILSGKGGVIENPTNPSSKFRGVNQEAYSLKWTLISSCGENSDTVIIDFDELVIKKTFIVVDNTDTLYSDSAQIANGIYKIKFSDPTIVPFDSLVLIGIRDDYKFIRRVTAFSLINSIYTFNTIQGTFVDVISSGTLNMGEAVNESMMVESNPVRKSRQSLYRTNSLPTRESLINGSDSNEIRILYTNTEIVEDSTSKDSSGMLKVRSYLGPFRAPTQTTSDGFTLNIPDVTLLQSPDEKLTLKLSDAWIKIAPHFVFNYKIGFFTIKNIKIGIDDGYFQSNYKISLDAQIKKEFSKELKLLHYSTNCCFAIGPLPIWIQTEFAVVAKASASVSGALNYTQSKNYKASMTALIVGSKISNLHTTYKPLKVETSSEESWNIKGELNASLKIGPELSFKLYGIIGPYVNVPATAKIGFCANKDGNWKTVGDLGFEANIGAKAELFGWTLFDCSYTLFSKSFYKIEIPYRLEMISGNNQTAKAGEVLPGAVTVRVVSDKGFGVPRVPVRFSVESGDGTVSNSVAESDITGLVDVRWTVGSDDTNILKVRLLDCDNQDMENSPMYFYANPPLGCEDNNFVLKLNSQEIYITPSVSGGIAPYLYSTDGIKFGPEVPVFTQLNPGNYTVYAKDSARCIISKSFVIDKVDLCKNSTLSVDVFSQANFVTATGAGGHPPYKYSIDDNTDFGNVNSFYRLQTGSHTIYVKDSYDCINSSTINIDLKDAAIFAVFPKTGSLVHATSLVNFQWTAGNYVTNQIYDLYLSKKGEESVLIASNLTETAYAYNKMLDKSTTYFWTIVVKNPNGIEIDDFESVFATSNGSPVSTPELLAPTDNESLETTSTPIILKWISQGDGYEYDLYFDNHDATKLIANNLKVAQFTVQNHIGGKSYYWKVKAKSTATGENLTSAIYSYNALTTPVLGSTTTASQITKTDVKCGGIITNDGGLAINARGVCWNTNSNPTTSDVKTIDGSGSGQFTSTLTNLLPGTKYYVKSYAVNNLGTSYGSEISFTTETTVPEVSTLVISSLTKNSANAGGNVNSDGGETVIARGICWSIVPNPTTDLSTKTIDGTGIGLFTRTISGLTAGTKYYIRAYAINSNGTSYGNEVTFTTPALPVLNTTDIFEITATSAVGGGNITSDGGVTVNTRGICWSTIQNPTIGLITKTSNGTGTGSFSSSITGLAAGTNYYVRAYATNSVGTSYGNEVSFTAVSLPKLTTISVSEIDATTATSGGNITLDGGSLPTERGICWSTSPNPTVDLNSKTSDGTGSGIFVSSLTGLAMGTKYYVRAYATNIVGTSYGEQMNFTTLALPVVTTLDVTAITGATANSGGNITTDGGATITARGVCWSTSPGPSSELATKTSDGIGNSFFTSTINGLSLGTKYFVKAYATNSVGTAYGTELVFTTLMLPILSTNEVTAITGTTATCGGNITLDGGSPITERGVCWSTSANPTFNLVSKSNDGAGIGAFGSALTGLNAGTTYYVRTYAINSIGISYGSEVSFRTLSSPTLIIKSMSEITEVTATISSEITSNGGGDVIARGVCWSIYSNPTIALTDKTVDGSGSGTFNSSLTRLSGGATYYIRAYATNSVGTAYSPEVQLKTSSSTGKVTDIDGNIYHSVKIGTQTWLTENLNTTRYRNGVAIPNVTDAETWKTTNTGAWCYYNNDPANGIKYGKLYNSAIETREIAPQGWHVPTGDEWTILQNYLISNRYNYDGTTIGNKEGKSVAGTTDWSVSDVIGAVGNDLTKNNSSGFNALPGGSRYKFTGDFLSLGDIGVFLTASGNDIITSIEKSNVSMAIGNYNSFIGMSIRCLKGDAPIVTTLVANGVSAISAVCSGEVATDDAYPITERGISWSTTEDPTLSTNTKVIATKAETGEFSITLSTPNMMGRIIYFRAYAINSLGTTYGPILSYTLLNVPTISLNKQTVVSGTTANIESNISENGGDEVIARGICWSTDINPTVELETKTIDGNGIGSFTSSITGLTPGTTYYFRGYATNTVGTAYYNQTTFTTFNIPTIETSSVDHITGTNARVYGLLSGEGGSNILSMGICWGTTQNPTVEFNQKTIDKSGSTSINNELTGLTPGTTYYVRAYATNIVGTAYGTEISFKTNSLPVVSNTVVTSITDKSAYGGGSLTSDGDNTVTALGVCWSTFPSPTVDLETKTNASFTTATDFGCSISGLTTGINYYMRAYATNSVGTAYGNEIAFKTLALPVVTTTEMSDICAYIATGGGNVIDTGGTPVTARGVCWSTDHNPTIGLTTKTSNENGGGAFVSILDSYLFAGRTYYVRAYATNSVGTAYGPEISFQTASLPTIITTNISSLTGSTAISGGNVTSNSGSTITAQGICWSTDQNPTIDLSTKTMDGASTGAFSSNVTGLLSGTWYYVRAYATNCVGTSYGSNISFKTPVLPTVTTKAISVITSTSVNSGGTVTADGDATVTAQGVCWSTNHNPTIETGSKISANLIATTFDCAVNGLTVGTIYYLRAFATNCVGTSYGTEVLVKVADVFDIDGNGYFGVTIGNQTWLAQNLNTSKYRNAEDIPNETTLANWTNLTTGAWANYNNDPANSKINGKLYNWYAATDARNIAPVGWHVPTYAEWLIMLNYIEAHGLNYEGQIISGKPASSLASTTDWIYNNSVYQCPGQSLNTNNFTGFSGLPSGNLEISRGGAFYGLGNSTKWWTSSTDLISIYKRSIDLSNNSAGIIADLYVNYKEDGKSIRCLKGDMPAIKTTAINANAGGTTATCTGDVTNDYGGVVTARGFCWSTSPTPTIALTTKTLVGTGLGAFSVSITGLLPVTTYFVRAYATNCYGTNYGNEVTVTTTIGAPIIFSTSLSAINNGTAIGVGTITSDGGLSILAKGYCWSTSPTPTISLTTKTDDGRGVGVFSSAITGLTGNVSYYIRAYATNSVGTNYGETFTVVADIDGNFYRTVVIGGKTWMKDNLRTTKYRNGNAITYASTSSAWLTAEIGKSGAYTFNNSSIDNEKIYGKLYNWYAVCNTNNLAPIGWHVATIDDLNSLPQRYTELRETGTTYWTVDNGSTNSSGFSALPGGDYRGSVESMIYRFNFLNDIFTFWTSNEDNTNVNEAKSASVISGNSYLYIDSWGKGTGKSVRCVKD